MRSLLHGGDVLGGKDVLASEVILGGAWLASGYSVYHFHVVPDDYPIVMAGVIGRGEYAASKMQEPEEESYDPSY